MAGEYSESPRRATSDATSGAAHETSSPGTRLAPGEQGSAQRSSERSGSHAAPPSRSRRSPFGGYGRVAAFWGAILAVFLVGGVIPYPYVIESPGPTYNVLGEVNGRKVIEVTGREQFPANGALAMTTVYVTGGPGSPVKGFDLVRAWMSSSSEILPVEEVYPEGVTREKITQNNKLEMDNSQAAATAAALAFEKIPFTRRLVIQEVVAGGASHGRLQVGDVVLSVDGKPATDVATLRNAVKAAGGKAVDVVVLRAGARTAVTVKPSEANGSFVLGIALKNDFSFPYTPKFNLQGVGGPSAGMMFALGLIDQLKPGDLTGGKSIAGTGTITAEGVVGPIGGIQQKMAAAKRDGAQYFLAPDQNCGDVVGNVPNGLTVVKVSTLAEAHRTVEAIGQGKTPESDPAAFPTCS